MVASLRMKNESYTIDMSKIHSSFYILHSSLILFLDRVVSESATKFVEDFAVHFTEHHGGVHLATIKKRKTLKGTTTVFIMFAQYGKSNEHFVGVQTRVIAVKH